MLEIILASCIGLLIIMLALSGFSYRLLEKEVIKARESSDDLRFHLSQVTKEKYIRVRIAAEDPKEPVFNKGRVVAIGYNGTAMSTEDVHNSVKEAVKAAAESKIKELGFANCEIVVSDGY